MRARVRSFESCYTARRTDSLGAELNDTEHLQPSLHNNNNTISHYYYC